MEGLNTKLKFWRQRAATVTPSSTPVSEDTLHLFRLRREHHLLQARFKGLDEPFQTLLLDVNLEQQHLLLDEPFPHRFPIQSWIGRSLSVSTREGSLATRFDSRVTGVMAQPEGNALVVAMPRDIMAAQRRHRFRLAIDGRMPVDAVVRIPEQGNLAAQVRDLSAAGVRLVIPGAFHSVSDDAKLCLRLGSESPMVTTLSVRSLTASEQEEPMTELGAEMTGLNSTEVKAVERFLVRMQRLLRRREMETDLT